jgi:zinc protease
VIAGVFGREKLGEELRDAAERMGGLKIDKQLLDRERERLLLEVDNMFGGMPALGAFNRAGEKLRPTPRGGRRGGLPDHVKTITLEDVRDHWKKYYKPRNAILVLAGRFDAKEARDAIAKSFEELAGGEALPESGAPGKPQPGGHEEWEEKSVMEGARPYAALGFAAPAPDSELYVPYLVAMVRLIMNARKLGVGPQEMPIRCALLDDPSRGALIVPLKKDETAKDAVARLDAYVAESLQKPFRDSDRAAIRTQLGMMLGVTPIPKQMIGMNPYFVAFSEGRRLQMGIDPTKLSKAFDDVKDEDLRKAAAQIFAPERRAAVVMRPKD